MGLEYRVVVQSAALHDMTRIVTYLANDLENPTAAGHMADRFDAAIRSLSTLPTRCAPYVPPRKLLHEYCKLVMGNYLVFFYVSEEAETVTVARVLYGRSRHEEVLP